MIGKIRVREVASELKDCPMPGCGGRPVLLPDGGSFANMCSRCFVQGPTADTEAGADAGWNALPRWGWHPAADPPQLPPGSAGVYVWAERTDGRRHPWWYAGAGDLLWPDVRRWHGMPWADGGDGR